MSREAEVIAHMVASNNVRRRSLGVIAAWLAENTEIPDPIEAAKELIKAQGNAGLVTMIRADLDRYVTAIRSRARAARPCCGLPARLHVQPAIIAPIEN